jgi:hypothetical protein
MKYAIIEIPAEVHTDLIKGMLKLGIEATTIGIAEDNDMILKCGYDEHQENEMDEMKAFAHLLKFFKVLDRLKKRANAA